MRKEAEAGQEPSAKDLILILTVLEQGKSQYTNSMIDGRGNETDPHRLAIEQAIPLRDRLRQAA